MVLDRLFRPRPALIAGRALYAEAVEQARAPALYGELGAPDTVEGRFDLYSLHVVLLLDRLRGQGEAAAEVSQAMRQREVVGEVAEHPARPKRQRFVEQEIHGISFRA